MRHIENLPPTTISPRQGDQFLQTDPIGSKDDLDLYAYTADDPIDRSDPTGLDAAFKIYDQNQAAGLGHVMAAYVDNKGNVTAVQSTGDPNRGVEQVRLGKVEVDKNGNVTGKGIQTLQGEAGAYWKSTGADKNPSVSSTEFSAATNKKGFEAQMQKEIKASQAAGNKVGSLVGGNDGQYHFIGNSCVDVANRVVGAAGAKDNSTVWIPTSERYDEQHPGVNTPYIYN